MRQGRTLGALLAAAVALVLLAAPAAALINPFFTPVDLIKQSKYVVLVKAGPEANRKIPLQVVRTLKGKAPAKNLVLDLDAAPAKEHGVELARLLAGTPEGTPILCDPAARPVHGVQGSGARRGPLSVGVGANPRKGCSTPRKPVFSASWTTLASH